MRTAKWFLGLVFVALILGACTTNAATPTLTPPMATPAPKATTENLPGPQVFFPKPGTWFRIGETHTIQWVSSPIRSGHIDIDLYDSNGKRILAPFTRVATAVDQNGSVVWNVSKELLPGHYQLTFNPSYENSHGVLDLPEGTFYETWKTTQVPIEIVP